MGARPLWCLAPWGGLRSSLTGGFIGGRLLSESWLDLTLSDFECSLSGGGVILSKGSFVSSDGLKSALRCAVWLLSPFRIFFDSTFLIRHEATFDLLDVSSRDEDFCILGFLSV